MGWMSVEEFNARAALCTIISIHHRGDNHPYSEISEWIEATCPSFHHASYGYIVDYYFTDEKDAIMFSLRWA